MTEADQILKQAIELQRSGKIQEAVDALKTGADEDKIDERGHYFLGVLLDATGDLDAAEKQLVRSLQIQPNFADAHYSLANVLQKKGQLEFALQAYTRCINLKPDHVHALVNAALVAQGLERFDDAVKCAVYAVELAPEETKAWLAWLGSLGYARKFEEGFNAAQTAIDRFPNDPEILHMVGNLYVAAERLDRGFEFYQQALKLAADSPKILNSIGDFLSQNKNGLDAIPYHEKALKADPTLVEGLHGLGTAYLKAGHPALAVPQYLKAIEAGTPNKDTWDGLLLGIQYLESIDEKEVFKMHETWSARFAQKFYPIDRKPLRSIGQDEKLRIGLMSPDFRDHSVARFIPSVIRHAEEHGMELYCYDDTKSESKVGEGLRQLGGTWFRTARLTDEQLAVKIEENEIDVLVDLAGHTGNHRLFVFARAPAPLQISWLGYPNTTGLKTVDYRLSDRVADPVGHTDTLSSEELVRIPNGFHCFEPSVDLPDVSELPAETEGHITFGSFNNQSKINGFTIERWAKILKAIPTARLLLKNHQLSDERNRIRWRQAFERFEVEEKRLEMVGYCNTLEEHYDTYSKVDIGLDTFPYNGTTTTCEALWMGVPVLTMPGETQRSRTGASLLTHAGLAAEWVATTEDDWLKKAVHWSKNLDELSTLRAGLRQIVEDSAIGDGSDFATRWFGAVRGAWEKTSSTS